MRPPLKSNGKRAVKLLVNARPAIPYNPYPRAEEPVLRRFSRAGMGWLCALLVLTAGGGCAAPTPAINYAPQTAQVTVENHTDWPWRIAFVRVVNTAAPATAALSAPPATAGLPWQPVAPREILKLNLSGGIYRVHRELLRATTESADLAPASATDAGVSLWFVPGRSYTWPLATLFSTEEGSQ